MIVTRSWLSEFIDLSRISDEKLYETFNSIGLEVDSINKIEIDSHVVVGEIISCAKHPDADKLNVCQIDVGSGIRQIVCGASNVVDARFVAVATIGAVLPEKFIIKHAKLRGVESEGMVCASSELGLPNMGKGIMILDDSIGELIVGKPLNEYPKVADTIIELELTANRGDCLSIYGVARDLSAGLDINLKPFEYKPEDRVKLGIAREANITHSGEIDASLHYKLAKIGSISSTFLINLRLAIVGVESSGALDSILAYSTHTTGVVLRAYDSTLFRNDNNKVSVLAQSSTKGIIDIMANGDKLSTLGVSQDTKGKANDSTSEILLEGSYIDPDTLVESVSTSNSPLEKDELYYKTSRGSNPDLYFGLLFLGYMLFENSDISCYEGSLNINNKNEPHTVVVEAKSISSIVGMDIEISKIVTILKKLGFNISSTAHDIVSVQVPLFRHDIRHIQDIAEEIVRIVGINNIASKPLVFAEKPRLNSTTNRYRAKKELRNRAVGLSFYENISYVFSEKEVLDKYGFITVEDELDVANPIAKELNTLRSTILINLLNAIKRNRSHSRKSIPLFEIGAVFGSKREQRDVVSFVFSGEVEGDSISNAGKPKDIEFASFVQKLGGVIGAFELTSCRYSNRLIHPYQSANIIIDGKVCGFVSKLHPTVQDDFDIDTTFIAEIELDALLPKHINAKPISKFQGVYKDLSIVIDNSISYKAIEDSIKTLNIEILKDIYPVDIYTDEKLGEKKSLSIRLWIQSETKTLEDSDIESLIEQIMQMLQTNFDAQLR